MTGQARGQDVVVFQFGRNHSQNTPLAPEAFQSVETVLVDKDYKEIRALEKVMPEARVLMCHVHAIRAFKKYVQSKTGDVKGPVDLFKSILHAPTVKEYRVRTRMLRRMYPQIFHNYFVPNWHNCREMWVSAWRRCVLTLGDNTTNKIEAVNRVIGDQLTGYERMSTAAEKLLSMTGQWNNKNEREDAVSYLKSQEYGYLTPRLNDVVSRLTPYAAKKVIEEWNRKSSGASLSRATGSSCSCRFFCQLEMLCVHLLHEVNRGKLTPEELLKKCMWLNWGPAEPWAKQLCYYHRESALPQPQIGTLFRRPLSTG